MKFRTTLLAGGVALAMLAMGSAGAADKCKKPTEFKLAFNQTQDHPQYKAGVEFGKRLLKATNGCYTIKVYPNETLGTQTSVLNNIADGSVAMGWFGGPPIEGLNPDAVVFNLPYMFDSYEAQSAVLGDDTVMGEFKNSLVASKHLRILTMVYAGTRNVYSKKAVRNIADLTGQKIRVQQSDSQVKMIQAMGAVATPMGQGDVYSALQTGTLDGAENNETVFDALKHDEVAKFYNYTKHLMIPDYLVMNSDILAKMPAADQKALLDLVPGVTKIANEEFQKFVADSIKKAKAKKATFVTDVDVAAFKASVAGLVKEYINNPVRQKLYDAIQAANAKYAKK
ncbi:MAG: DctP family TRAP transporter solute-binding subunit [Candidatus Accumulibacter sp.]|jgi:tripartite ATP-independent transporter DctP family solute receptor|nr:DctP family TRAP transporter solute-binding subunit [Accumulibacter sp.]